MDPRKDRLQRDQLILDHILNHVLELHEKHPTRLAITTFNMTCIEDVICMDPEDIRALHCLDRERNPVTVPPQATGVLMPFSRFVRSLASHGITLDDNTWLKITRDQFAYFLASKAKAHDIGDNDTTDIPNLASFLASEVKTQNIGGNDTIDVPNGKFDSTEDNGITPSTDTTDIDRTQFIRTADDSITTGADSSNSAFHVCPSWDPNTNTTDVVTKNNINTNIADIGST